MKGKMKGKFCGAAGLLLVILCMTLFAAVSVSAATHSTKLNGTSYSRVYDYDYYTTKVHPELKGKSDSAVLSYFVNTGMAKGEQAIATFSPKSYRRGNQSLRIKYRKDWKQYYMHYQTTGYKNSSYSKSATGVKKITKPVTVYDGVNYAKVYNYYYYINRYKSVGKAFPEDDITALKNFVLYGLPKQYIGCKTFSVRSYRYNNPAVRSFYMDNYAGIARFYIAHPNKYGGATGVTKLKYPITKYKGVDLSKVFDYKYYTANNSVVAKYAVSKQNDDAAAIAHFAKVGIFQGLTAKAGMTKNKAAYKAALAEIRKVFPSGGAEEYIKADQYSSSTNYLILLNQSKHLVYIFKGSQGNWTKVKAFPCCVGKPSTPTPTGIFKAGGKGPYFWTGECRCWYYTQITGSILFHSQIYDGSSAPVNCVDASMGVSCSHGCVRLHLSNAKWVYDNIPRGTKIVSYR